MIWGSFYEQMQEERSTLLLLLLYGGLSKLRPLSLVSCQKDNEVVTSLPSQTFLWTWGLFCCDAVAAFVATFVTHSCQNVIVMSWTNNRCVLRRIRAAKQVGQWHPFLSPITDQANLIISFQAPSGRFVGGSGVRVRVRAIFLLYQWFVFAP